MRHATFAIMACAVAASGNKHGKSPTVLAPRGYFHITSIKLCACILEDRARAMQLTLFPRPHRQLQYQPPRPSRCSLYQSNASVSCYSCWCPGGIWSEIFRLCASPKTVSVQACWPADEARTPELNTVSRPEMQWWMPDAQKNMSSMCHAVSLQKLLTALLPVHEVGARVGLGQKWLGFAKNRLCAACWPAG